MRKRINHSASQTVSAQTRVADDLRHAIFRGELLPGDPITETLLASSYKVSQTTMREALIHLEHAGLVRRIRNIGTLVTQMSAREIQERIRLRVMLEAVAVMDAACVAPPEQLEEIENSLRQFAQAITGENYFEAAQADLAFHRGIWRASGDKTLYQILDQLTVPLFAFVAMERRRLRQRQTESDVHSHTRIVSALREQNPDAAEKAMQMHFDVFYGEFPGARPGYTLAVRTPVAARGSD